MGLLHTVMLVQSHLRDALDSRNKRQPCQQPQQQMCKEAYEAGEVALQAGLYAAGMHRKGLDLGSLQPGHGTYYTCSALLSRKVIDAVQCMTILGEHALLLPLCRCCKARGVSQPTVC